MDDPNIMVVTYEELKEVELTLMVTEDNQGNMSTSASPVLASFLKENSEKSLNSDITYKIVTSSLNSNVFSYKF